MLLISLSWISYVELASHEKKKGKKHAIGSSSEKKKGKKHDIESSSGGKKKLTTLVVQSRKARKMGKNL